MQTPQEAIDGRKKWDASFLSPSHTTQDGTLLSIIRYNAGFASADELSCAMRDVEGGSYPSLKTVQAVESNQAPPTPHYMLLFRIVMGALSLSTPCPTCGKAHPVDDCHGKEGQPVILGDGERITRQRTAKRTPSPSAHRRKELRARCKAKGLTLEDAAEMMLDTLESEEGNRE